MISILPIVLAILHALAAFILFWYSAESRDRQPMHRAALYTFAFSMMCWASANLLDVLGRPASEWIWMVDLGHVSMIMFALLWIGREFFVKAMIEARDD